MAQTVYPQVLVEVSAEDAELASLALFEVGALGIEERGPGTLNRPEQELPDGRLTLIASFADEAGAVAAARSLGERWPARAASIVDDGWRDGWKAHFKPTRIGARLVVRPSWENYTPQAGDVVLTLDPGYAFGTGTHETTRLILRELEASAVEDREVLDVGCGSGILSIAALLLGARRAVAIDVDDDAVRSSSENAVANAVETRVHVSRTPLSEIGERYPLVLANIETRVLVPLAEALIARVAPGGTLLLSGILEHEEQTVRQAYAALRLVRVRHDGNWIALAYERSPDGG